MRACNTLNVKKAPLILDSAVISAGLGGVIAYGRRLPSRLLLRGCYAIIHRTPGAHAMLDFTRLLICDTTFRSE